MTSHRFSRWRKRHGNVISNFVFGDLRSKFTCVPISVTFLYLWLRSTTSSFCKQMSAMLEFYFRFRFSHFPSSSACHSASACQISPKLDHPRHRVMTSHPFFKMAATASQFYFRFHFLWVRSFRKIKIYLQTKFWQDISIHGWDITASVFWKQMSTMLEFYARFRFSRLHHQPAKFHSNWTILNRVMTSYPFFKMAAMASQFYFCFVFREYGQLGRSDSTCRPTINKISQSMVEILLLLVSENKPNLSVFCRKCGQNAKFRFRDPEKAHPCMQQRLLTYWSSKLVQQPWR